MKRNMICLIESTKIDEKIKARRRLVYIRFLTILFFPRLFYSDYTNTPFFADL